MRSAFILPIRKNIFVLWTQHSTERSTLSLKDRTGSAIAMKAEKLHLFQPQNIRSRQLVHTEGISKRDEIAAEKNTTN